MPQRFLTAVLAVLIAGLAGARPAAADDYAVDDMHSAVTFKLSHLGLSWTYGRFNDVAGTFTVDPTNPAKSSFNLMIKADSIDTNNAKRDGHLRSPDFLNVKQFPAITFKSTAVKAIKDGYKVTGDFNLHGVTKSITFLLLGGRTVDMKGMTRTGYSTELKVKRTDYGIGEKFGKGMLGDDVHIAISFEGVKK